jgi:hypothetical protein
MEGNMIRITLFLLSLAIVTAVDALSQGQKGKTLFLEVRLESKDTEQPFAFEAVCVRRTRENTSSLEVIRQDAPYRLRVDRDLVYLLVRGAKNKGKVFFKYSASGESKESMQYLESEEVLFVRWAPGGFEGPVVSWASKSKYQASPHDLVVSAHTNQ